MDSRATHLIGVGNKLFTDKMGWNSLCQDIAENFYPLRADFTSSLGLGDDFGSDLMESYPVLARETLGNAPSAMLRQGDWFEVKTGIEETDEDPTVSRWLEWATTRLRRAVYDRRSCFVKATGQADHDWAAFGNPVLSVEEGASREHLYFRAWHPRDCVWMENEVGVIDHLQRKMKMTARTMKRRWKNVHAEVETAAAENPTQEFEVRHIVVPTDEIYADDRKMRRKYANKPFLSLYVDVVHQEVLGQGGLPAFTYVVPRWRTVTGISHGFSPATITALPDGRMLQDMARIILEQGEKAVDTPLVGRGEAFQNGMNLYAGGFTYADLEADEDIRQAIMAVPVGGNIGIGLELKNDVRELIAESFLLNKLWLPDTRQMTAYETQQRMDEFRRAALPFFGPIESEYHLPLLDVAFTLLINSGYIDREDIPEQLEGEDVTFTFDSPLNTAEGRANVSAFQESVQILAGSAQFDDTIPTLMDFKTMTKDAIRGTGAKADWFADEEVQQSAEESAASAARLQQAASFLSQGAGVAGQVAEATTAMQQAGIA